MRKFYLESYRLETNFETDFYFDSDYIIEKIKNSLTHRSMIGVVLFLDHVSFKVVIQAVLRRVFVDDSLGFRYGSSKVYYTLKFW